jgi:hypothetical protein
MGLLNLPNELLDRIVQCSDSRSQKSLACTCGRFAMIAEPRTVQSIFLGRELESWVMPLRKLIRRPYLRPFVEEISVAVELENDIPDTQDLLDLFSRQDWMDLVTSEDDRRLFVSLQLLSDADDVEITQALVAMLIAISNHLVRLDVMFPSNDNDRDYHILDDALTDMLQGANGFPMLPTTIRHLGVQCNMDLDRPNMNMATCPSLFKIPSITHFYVQGHDPWRDVEVLKTSPMFPSLVAYHSDWFLRGGDHWYEILSKCTKLKTFTVAVSFFCEHGVSNLSRDLNAGLLLRADTLETLDLDFSASRVDSMFQDLGTAGWLRCLPQLHRLLELSIDTFVLFGSFRFMFPGHDLFEERARALPLSLRRLKLTETFDDESDPTHVDVLPLLDHYKHQMRDFVKLVWRDQGRREGLGLEHFQYVGKRAIWEAGITFPCEDMEGFELELVS